MIMLWVSPDTLPQTSAGFTELIDYLLAHPPGSDGRDTWLQTRHEIDQCRISHEPALPIWVAPSIARGSLTYRWLSDLFLAWERAANVAPVHRAQFWEWHGHLMSRVRDVRVNRVACGEDRQWWPRATTVTEEMRAWRLQVLGLQPVDAPPAYEQRDPWMAADPPIRVRETPTIRTPPEIGRRVRVVR